MKHLGDITKINGAEIEPVDCIIGGSPCQDLSVAGKRAGLAGERSGLFMEQIRIVKEMREHERRIRGTDDDFRLRPRYMVWENVPGAFSSNKGKDFQAVLTEIVRIVRPDAPDVPLPDRGGWSKSGCIMGYGSTGCPFSIAWRLHDAQFWGVPQRRKRIALVADFGGLSAPEICFERKGLSRDTEESEEPRKDAATDAGAGTTQAGRAISSQERSGKPGGGKGILIQDERTGALSTLNNQSVCCLNDQGGSQMGVTEDVTGTLRAEEHGHQPVVFGISSYDSNAMKSSNPHSGIYEADTSRTLDLNGGSPACNQGGMMVVQGFDGYNQQSTGDVAMPLRSKSADSDHVPIVCLEGNGSRPSHKGDGYAENEIMYTLNSTEHHAVAVENHPADSRVKISEDGVVQTLSSRMGTGGGNVPMVMESINGDISGTLDASYYKGCGERQGVEREVVCVGNGQLAQARLSPTVGTLNCMHDQQAVMTYQEHTGTVDACIGKGTSNQLANNDMFVANTSIVRRLTPLECERLQGFPDGWTDIGEWVDSKGKKHKESDSPRYKALGNSIAVGYANNGSGFWMWLLKRISAQYERNATLGSLFDGIGGFPLAWEHFNGKGSARWASEIEEFPIAVTKKHFPED